MICEQYLNRYLPHLHFKMEALSTVRGDYIMFKLDVKEAYFMGKAAGGQGSSPGSTGEFGLSGELQEVGTLPRAKDLFPGVYDGLPGDEDQSPIRECRHSDPVGRCQRRFGVVDLQPREDEWAAHSLEPTSSDNNNGCLPPRLGSTLRELQDRRTVVKGGEIPPHQLPRVIGGEAPVPRTTPLSGRLACLRRHYRASEVSESSTRLLLSLWRPPTNSKYDSAWNIWERWCSEHHRDPISPSIGAVVDVLADMFDKGRQQYRWYRSVLSTVLGPMEGFPTGKHRLVCRLLKGAFNFTHHNQYCSVDQVLCHIRSWGLNESLTLQKLTWKLAMILAFCSALI